MRVEWKVVDLYSDGTLIFAGLADHRFLAWHRKDKQKINPVSLIELIYSFAEFYELVLEDFEKMPNEFTLRVDFKNLHLNGVRTYLVPHDLSHVAHIFDDDKKDAPENNCTIKINNSAEGFNTAAISYKLVEKIYLWFGIEEDKIPYVKTENNIKMIDTDAIKALR